MKYVSAAPSALVPEVDTDSLLSKPALLSIAPVAVVPEVVFQRRKSKSASQLSAVITTVMFWARPIDNLYKSPLSPAATQPVITPVKPAPKSYASASISPMSPPVEASFALGHGRPVIVVTDELALLLFKSSASDTLFQPSGHTIQ